VLAHELDDDQRGVAIVKLNSTHQIGESTMPANAVHHQPSVDGF
jgi:hypothetical protein